MKKILGLDLGTNSIGWALVDQDFENKTGKILGMGSRIIPMSQDILGDFDKGNTVSQTAARTGFRGARRLRERHLLRRERLHRVLNILDFLPEHYANQIDFEQRLGQFYNETEPKLAYHNNDFFFKKSFEEMLEDFRTKQPELLNRKNKKGEDAKIPYDWTIYYLRKKALTQKLENEELAWLLLNFNQKRGYYQLRGEDDQDATRTAQTRIYFDTQTISEIIDIGETYKGLKVILIKLANGDTGKYFSKELPNWIGMEKNIIVTIDLDKEGNDKYEDDGALKRRFSIPTEEDWDKKWKLVKIKTENDLKSYIEEYKTKNGIDGTVGSYIYETLLQKPNQKIRGKLVRTIERKFYKDELKAILSKQIELQPELFNDDLYKDCLLELYRHNEAYQLQLSKRDFVHLFVEDIIFYQRPLKSKKSSIGNCSLEFRKYKTKDKDGKEIEKKEYLKAIPKSHPLYQEFRVWQWLYNLKIYKKADDIEITSEFIKGVEDLENLFDFLMKQKEVNHKDILQYFISPIMKEKFPGAKATALNKEIAKEVAKYRWNYVFDDSKEKEDEKSKKYPCNETGYEIRRLLKKIDSIPVDFLKIIDTKEITNKKTNQKEILNLGTREEQLWHIIYSVTDKNEFEKALKSFAHKYDLDESSFMDNFKKFKPFDSDYGSYSEKAIKKLLPLMRLGKYWNWEAIDKKTKDRIDKIINAEDDSEIRFLVREKAKEKKLERESDFQALQLWLAQYVVYNRHSEVTDIKHWKKSYDIQKYLYEFRQHELRNPIVEQVITETLRVVKDVWEHYGETQNVPYEMVYDERKKKNVKSFERFFDEIHIELGREMKNTADDRKRITKQISDNENTNQRIKLLLMELKKDSNIEGVREYSPSQQEALKIYEEGVLSSMKNKEYKEGEKTQKEEDEAMLKIGSTAQPSKSELQRYKLWLEQKYRSPYTGQMIPLSRLFTEDYQIEHVIPQSRYFDDGLSNKVICESVVNGYPYKGNQLGLEFIKSQGGRIVDELSSNGKIVKIFTEDEYRDFIRQHYGKNLGKRTKLLLEDIPDKMIARQINDTRYISKFIFNLLSNIVRIEDDMAKEIIANAEILANKETDKEKAEEIRQKAKSEANDDGVNSKNIIPGNGKITSTLKQDWGMNDVWNDLILPRFERMNELNREKRNELLSKKKELLENETLSEEGKKKQISELENKIQTLIFTATSKKGHTIPAIPLELAKGFQKKRIDHRHHALDALVIACATRDHVNLLNNQSAKSDTKRYDLQFKLRNTKKWIDQNGKEKDKFNEFKKPWKNFAIDTRKELEKIVVSFKQNLRVINKTTNKYESYKDENGQLRIGKDGKPKKGYLSQSKGNSWSIRKSLHTPLPYGERKYAFQVLEIKDNLGRRQFIENKEIIVKIEGIMDRFNGKIGQVKNYLKTNPIQDEKGMPIIHTVFNLSETRYRKRQPIMKLANRGQGGIKKQEDAIKLIRKISDKKIMNDLIKHLSESNNDIDLAFSREGIERFNQNRVHPVYKLPISEASFDKFPLGNTVNTKVKFGEADGGTNLFYAVYWNKKEDKRVFETIPFKKAINHQKASASLSKRNRTIIPKNTEKGELLFTLSPNDLVYLPTEDENVNDIDFENLSNEQIKRIFVVNDFSSTCYFTPNHLAKNIAPKEVDLSFDSEKNKLSGSYDTKTASFEGKQIKDVCIKLSVDRLGNIQLFPVTSIKS